MDCSINHIVGALWSNAEAASKAFLDQTLIARYRTEEVSLKLARKGLLHK